MRPKLIIMKYLIFLLFPFMLSGQTTLNVSHSNMQPFKDSFVYDAQGNLLTFDYSHLLKDVGEEHIEFALNTFGFSFRESVVNTRTGERLIEVKRDHYKSSGDCVFERFKACVLNPTLPDQRQ